MLQYLPAIIGGLGGLYDAMQGQQMQKQKQERLELADARNASDRKRIEALDPRLAMLRKYANIEDSTMAASNKAGNVVAGNIANKMGGDVSSTSVGAANATPIAEVFAQATGLKNAAIGERENEEMQKNQMMQDNTRTGLSIEEQQIYNEKPNLFSSAVTGALGGMNAMSSINNLLETDSNTVSQATSKEREGLADTLMMEDDSKPRRDTMGYPEDTMMAEDTNKPIRKTVGYPRSRTSWMKGQNDISSPSNTLFPFMNIPNHIKFNFGR